MVSKEGGRVGAVSLLMFWFVGSMAGARARARHSLPLEVKCSANDLPRIHTHTHRWLGLVWPPGRTDYSGFVDASRPRVILRSIWQQSR
uniref:Putative secreted protein n=1 Tax=Anopheles darlingi TaxID=43151 RepID=A0A2M4DJP1_ANODA